MKCLVVLVFFVGRFSIGQGQSRQIKMYLEHIAAGKVYIEYLQKGYSVARRGLGFISEVKNGHLKLDRLFFDGLVTINPRIRNYPHVIDIMVLATGIIETCNRNKRALASEGLLSAGMVTYSNRITALQIAGCLALLSDLADLLAANVLKLSDDERIRRIDEIHREMEERHSFITNWSTDTGKLLLQMKKESMEYGRMKGVYDLK